MQYGSLFRINSREESYLSANIKVIFMDIDGTLRNSNRKLTKRTINAVKKIQSLGINVILCSGRSRNHTQNVSKQVGASRFIISSNGADVYDYEKHKSIYNTFIENQACIQMYNVATQNNLRFIMNVDDVRYVTDSQDQDEMDRILNSTMEEFLKNHNVAQCILLDKDFNKMKRLQDEIEGIDSICAINKSKSLIFDDEPIDHKRTYFDLVSTKTSKGNAIKKMCEYLGVSLDQAMAFGDSVNDVQMFEVVGWPVVMGNASDDIKKLGKVIADTNDNDGVAQILERLYENRA